jgi:hypothetical protein
MRNLTICPADPLVWQTQTVQKMVQGLLQISGAFRGFRHLGPPHLRAVLLGPQPYSVSATNSLGGIFV